ncbi:hypothetical protein EDC01DRAFT_724780 [Geopyxis carbonaria]|nr:hypothetical protein EDC01DRAFT_724780 [Geopyxis carbonaria]
MFISILRRQLPRTRITSTLGRCRYSTEGTTTPARTRFAPSPTGFLHLGSLRTALYNYLLAKSTGGQLLLRIEDTDQKRTVPGAEQSILETLAHFGLQWDEGPDVGGPYGPYRQSERSALHREHADRLLQSGAAYRCFCTPTRLTALAVARKRQGLPTDYDRTCARVPADESASRAAAGESHVVRLRAPDVWPGFTDHIYGTLAAVDNTRAHSTGSFEDPVLLKSDGLPTYHLANVVDDHHMRITHVVRANEWMPSTPKHVHLYNTLGWTPPAFVHVGLLQDGQHRKLSKRHGDVFVNEFTARGYLPEALNNFVALLGWSHGEGSDVMALHDMVQRFDIARLTSGNTVTNFDKLKYLQKQHLTPVFADAARAEAVLSDVAEIVRITHGERLETGAEFGLDYIRAVLHANQQNYTLPGDFVGQSAYFFAAPDYANKAAKKTLRDLAGMDISAFVDEVEKIGEDEWAVETLAPVMDAGRDEDHKNWRARMRFVRLALAGGLPGPSVAATMAVLGRERSLDRLREGVALLVSGAAAGAV